MLDNSQHRTMILERRETNQVSMPRSSFQAVMQNGQREETQTKHRSSELRSQRLQSRMTRHLVFAGPSAREGEGTKASTQGN